MAASERVTIRVGAQYVVGIYRTERHYRLDSQSDNADEDGDVYTTLQEDWTSKYWIPRLNYALGLEYRPVPQVRLGLMVRTSYLERIGVATLEDLFASATVHW